MIQFSINSCFTNTIELYVSLYIASPVILIQSPLHAWNGRILESPCAGKLDEVFFGVSVIFQWIFRKIWVQWKHISAFFIFQTLFGKAKTQFSSSRLQGFQAQIVQGVLIGSILLFEYDPARNFLHSLYIILFILADVVGPHIRVLFNQGPDVETVDIH